MTRFLLILFVLIITWTPVYAQVFWVSPYTGTGTEDDPFIAAGVRQGATCKSLRADETKVDGVAVCKGPSLPVAAGVVQITGNDAGRISTANRAILSSRAGKTVTAETTSALLWELVDANKVAITRHRDGHQRIVVGGTVLASRPAPIATYIPDVLHGLNVAVHLPMIVTDYLMRTAVAWAVGTINEDWDCPDDSTSPFICDHIWVRSVGSSAQLISDSFRNVNSTNSNVVYNDTALDSTNMLVRVKILDINRGTANNVSGGPIARHPKNASTYVYCVARHAASSQLELGHVVTGSLTTDAIVSATVAAGNIIEIRAIGDQVSCRHNGVLAIGPITEATGSGNVNGGIRFSGSGTATTTLVALDDWHATNTIPVTQQRGPMVFQ